MNTKSVKFRAKVMSHWTVERFSGEAILAGVDPKFVVALLMPDSRSNSDIKNSGVKISTQAVAFFLVDSIIKTFGDSDVNGKEYDLSIIAREIDGELHFWIGV